VGITVEGASDVAREAADVVLRPGRVKGPSTGQAHSGRKLT